MDFREANAYTLWSTGRQDLTLKPKQEEGAIFHVTSTMVGTSSLVSPLAMASRCANSCCPHV